MVFGDGWFEYKRPHIEGRIFDKLGNIYTVNFLLDTGASICGLPESFIKNLGKASICGLPESFIKNLGKASIGVEKIKRKIRLNYWQYEY